MLKINNILFACKFTIFLLLFIPALSMAGSDLGGSSKRADKWEFNLTSRYINSQNIEFNGGATADFSDTVGWGFGMGYNLSENLEMAVDFNWSTISYTANYIDENDAPQTAGSSVNASSVNFTTSYNFLPRKFTPFVAGNLGWQFIDTNIASGPPVDSCWWYPYWGYICGDTQPTYTEQSFTYGGQAGMRFDLGNNMYVKGSIGKQYLDTRNGGVLDMTLYQVNLGFLFK